MSDRYDPQAVEDAPTRSEYFSRKDAKWILALVVVATIAAYPLYQWANDQKNKAVCSNNISDVYKALSIYANNNDDRFPALFNSDASGSPSVRNGRVETWASAMKVYHNGRTELRCPASEDDEDARTEWGGADVPITYGLYAAHATVNTTNIDSPDETILIAETSDLGTQGSFDPLPYKDEAGNKVSDAFVIGWDNSNEAPNAGTKQVTRLAFRGYSDGRTTEDTHPRHANGIHAVTVSGRRVLLKPDDSRTSWGVGTLRGQWRSQP